MIEPNPRPLLLALGLMLGAPAIAGSLGATELRGGPSVLSGAEDFRFQYHGDNDGYALAFHDGQQWDRWYSTGTKLTARWPMSAGFAGLPTRARVLAGVSLGQTIYTPRSIDIASEAELQGDRPYSGWLAGSASVDVILGTAPFAPWAGWLGYTQLGAELSVGTLGAWSLAGWTQVTSHRLSASMAGPESTQFPMPQGWGRVEAPGRMTADLSLFGETTAFAFDGRNGQDDAPRDARWAILGLVGTHVEAGATKVSAAAHVTAIAGLLSPPVAPRRTALPLSLQLFLRAEGRAVAWNATFEDTPYGVTRHPLVAEFGAGLIARVWILELTFAQLYRSNEVTSLPLELQHGQLLGQVVIALIH